MVLAQLVVILAIMQARSVLLIHRVIFVDRRCCVKPFDKFVDDKNLVIQVRAHLIVVHRISVSDQVLDSLGLFLNLFWLLEIICLWQHFLSFSSWRFLAHKEE